MIDRAPAITPERTASEWIGIALVCLLLASYVLQNVFTLKAMMTLGPFQDVDHIKAVYVFFSVLAIFVAIATAVALLAGKTPAANWIGVAGVLFCYPIVHVITQFVVALVARFPVGAPRISLSAAMLAGCACAYLLVSRRGPLRIGSPWRDALRERSYNLIKHIRS